MKVYRWFCALRWTCKREVLIVDDEDRIRSSVKDIPLFISAVQSPSIDLGQEDDSQASMSRNKIKLARIL